MDMCMVKQKPLSLPLLKTLEEGRCWQTGSIENEGGKEAKYIMADNGACRFRSDVVGMPK